MQELTDIKRNSIREKAIKEINESYGIQCFSTWRLSSSKTEICKLFLGSWEILEYDESKGHNVIIWIEYSK